MHLFRRSSSLFYVPPVMFALVARLAEYMPLVDPALPPPDACNLNLYEDGRHSVRSVFDEFFILILFCRGSHTSAFFSPLSCEEMKAIYTRTYGFLQMYTHSYMHLCSYLMIFHTYYESFDGLGQLAFGQ